jgi:hypothetical protein
MVGMAPPGVGIAHVPGGVAGRLPGNARTGSRLACARSGFRFRRPSVARAPSRIATSMICSIPQVHSIAPLVIRSACSLGGSAPISTRRDNGHAPVGVPHLHVAAALTDPLKPETES